MQLGKRKPLLKKSLADAGVQSSLCPAPVWQRTPVRVTFQASADQKLTFSVKSRVVDLASEEENEERSSESRTVLPGERVQHSAANQIKAQAEY